MGDIVPGQGGDILSVLELLYLWTTGTTPIPKTSNAS